MILNISNHYPYGGIVSPLALVRRPGQLFNIALVCFGVAACDNSPTDPAVEVIRTTTVDASTNWAYAAFAGDSAQVVSIADPAASAAWDLGFFKTSVRMNGGQTGPAGVVGYCICQNAGTSDADLQKMTAQSELADFEAVTRAQLPPAGAAWTSDVFDSASWYRYNLAGNHQIWPTYDVYLVKRGSDIYKVQLIGYYGPAGETRRITFRYAKLVG